METDSDFLDNHQQKCRFCFRSFGESTTAISITKSIESKFFELTQLRLKSSTKKYSQKICRACSTELTGYFTFRNKLLWRQQRLYELTDRESTRIRETATIIKTEVTSDEEVDGLSPLEYLCIPDNRVKAEAIENDPIDDFFVTTSAPLKKKKLLKAKSARKPFNWKHCQHCNKRFQTELTLQIHIDTFHFNFKSFQCDKCDFKTHTPGLLKGHVARIHDLTFTPPKARVMPKTSCPFCGLLVRRVSAHIRNVHTRPKNVFCDICGFGIFNLNRLRRHMYKHLSKETKFGLESYSCDLCGAILHSKNSIKLHMKNIHVETDGRNYKCFCGKSYKAESYLKIHQKLHEKTAKQQCPECDRKFMNPSQLKVHMEIHERKGRKDFSCEICGGMYGSMNLLIRHKIFHTEPKFACQYCDKKFHRPCLVDRHVKRKHEIEEVPCQYCGKMLNTMSMTRHVKEFHSGLPRLNCPVPACNANFLRRFHLKDHIQRTHKDFLSCLSADERTALEEKISQMSLI